MKLNKQSDDFELSGKAKDHNLSDKQLKVVNRLASRHGSPRLAVENGGLHAYIPSPEALKLDGKVELYKKHLSVNIDKFLSGDDNSSFCHKYDKEYSTEGLLRFLSLEDRGFPNVSKSLKLNLLHDDLEKDEHNEVIPIKAGKLISVNELDKNHPAVLYLKNRPGGSYDLDKLVSQFNLSYCAEENKDVYGKYKSFTDGFRKTPLGRIVFEVYTFGDYLGFQARILEASDDTYIYYFEPTSYKWIAVYKNSNLLDKEQRDINQKTKEYRPWTLIDRYTHPYRLDLPKYIIGAGMKKNKSLMGFDAAVQLSKQFANRPVFCVEGPMDAARVYQAGYPSVAVIGKYLSQTQASFIINNFNSYYLISDNDYGGDTLKEKFDQRMQLYGKSFTQIKVPEGSKDIGELSPKQVNTLLKRYV